jgi:hypothetical protein
MSDTGFFGFLTAILTGGLAALAGRVDWPTIPPVGWMLLVGVAVAGVAVLLVAVGWAADAELAQPAAQPIC